MTQRERQLLRWIGENPMISQQGLAERADITRFFQDQGVTYEWHYIAVSPEAWLLSPPE